MKLHLSSSILRGLVFTFVAYQCAWWGRSLWSDMVARWPSRIVISSIFLLPFLLAAVGLLFRPVQSARPVFVLLALYSAYCCFAVWLTFSYFYRGEFSPFRPAVSELVIMLVAAVAAFMYQRRLRSARPRPNHALQRTEAGV